MLNGVVHMVHKQTPLMIPFDTFLGQKLQRAITALMLFDRQQRDLTVDAEMPEAQTTFHLRYKHVLGKTLESGTRLYEFMYDVYLNRMSRYLLRTLLHVCYK